ncbi:hypothetical protein D3C87_130380 [compost metagenome]
MNSLSQMTNLEKGKLLSHLFPNEIDGIFITMTGIFKIIKENKTEVGKNWNNPFISLEQWCKLAELSNDIIVKNKGKKINANRFAQDFFDGYIAFFTIHCIIKYATNERMDTKFWHIVQAFFMLE